MSDTGGLEGVEVYDAHGAYVLGSSDDGYRVWDIHAPDTPIATFPGTDDGLDRAELLFERLWREERRARDPWSPWARRVAFGGLGVWVVSGIVVAIIAATTRFEFQNEGSDVALRVVQVVNTAAYYIWVAAVVTAVLLWLAHPSAPGVRPLRGKDPGPA